MMNPGRAVPTDRSADERRDVDRRVVELAMRQHGVVSRAQVLRLGLLPGALQRRVDGARLRQLHRGVYAVGPFLPARGRYMAALLACGPNATISHGSAASLHGILDSSDDLIDVSVPVTHGRRRPGLRIRRARFAADEVTVVDDLRVTTPLRTLVDLAAVVDERSLERALARAEREGFVCAEDLTTAASRYRGRSLAPLRAILRRAGGPALTRSAAEARFLALIRRAQLPAPRTNATVGEFEVDFFWPAQRVIVEIDGFRYHGSRSRFESDRRRGARLAALGFQVVPLTWRQVVDHEVATIAQLARILARGERD